LRILLALLLAAAPAFADFGDHFAVSDDVGVTKVPRFDHTKVLVIRIDIGTPNDWGDETLYFDADDSPQGTFGPYTFRRFWQHASAGRFDPEPVYPEPLSYPSCPSPDGVCDLALNFDRMYGLLEVLLDDLRARDALDLSDLDLSGPDGVPDGVLDGVVVLMDPDDMTIGLAGGVTGTAGSSEAFVDGPTIERDGVAVNLFAYANTLRAVPGVATHEFGHEIGFADSYFPGWEMELSLMNACDWCNLDAHARVLAGWADVVWVTEPGTRTIEIEPAFETGKVYRTGGATEFWLLENRQEVSVAGGVWDFGMDGLAIYHCDESLPFPQWALSNYDPWHALTVNLWSAATDPPRLLFQEGDALLPAADHAPPSETDEFRTDSNRFDGTRSGFAVEDVTRLGVTAGHSLASYQAELVPADGSIGPPDAGALDAGADAAPDGGADAGTVTKKDDDGCGCRATGPSGALGAGSLLIFLVRRRCAR
jgi:M6 family metalloprotease-like protein